MSTRRPTLLFVGSFASDPTRVLGGQLAACSSLVRSERWRDAELVLLDSTQISHPPPGLPLRGARASARIAAFVRHLVVARPDAALIFTASGVSLLEKGLMATIARAFGIPSILAPRSGHLRVETERSPTFRRAVRKLLGVPSLILCQGPQWKSFLERELGVPAAKLRVQRNWIDAGELVGFSPERRGAPLRILFVGWLERQKGVFELLRAFAGSAALQAAHLDFVGHGHARGELEALASELGVAGRVRFHGWLVGAKKHERFEQADIFVLPSHAEGFPNVLLEAMAAALPVVTTPVGAIEDVVQHERNGLLVPVGDVTALALALERLAADPTWRWRIGRSNRAQVVAEHSVSEAAARIWEMLSEVSPAFATAPARPVPDPR